MKRKGFLFFIWTFWVAFLGAQAETVDFTCINAGCHGDILNVETLHPVLEDGCENCHEKNEQAHPMGEGNEFKLMAEIPELCLTCHDQEETSTNIHVPYGEGECLTCHSPHGSNEEHLLVYENNAICLECHDLEIENDPVRHAPVEGEQCGDCHAPHSSVNSALLTVPSPELCFNCHEDQKEELTMASVHPAFEADCMDCHVPHHGTIPSLLSEKVPELCLNCHQEIMKETESTVSIHQPLKTDQSCSACHLSHAGETEHLLIKTTDNLCTECHGTNMNSRNKLSEYEYVHAPALDGECNTCHKAHQSDKSHLLTLSYPLKTYVSWATDTYALCFECHDADMIIVERTTDITEFRNGDVNLHYVHVNKEKGRTCHNCHTLHGSDYPHLLAAFIPFAQWEMPLIFTSSENGGTCRTACHKELTYKR